MFGLVMENIQRKARRMKGKPWAGEMKVKKFAIISQIKWRISTADKKKLAYMNNRDNEGALLIIWAIQKGKRHYPIHSLNKPLSWSSNKSELLFWQRAKCTVPPNRGGYKRLTLHHQN